MPYPPFHPALEPPPEPAHWTDQAFNGAFPGETEYIEFKTGLSSTPVQEAVVAFSNADGGVIVFGVRDNGEIQGHELTPAVAEVLHRTIADVRSPGRYQLHAATVGTRPITLLAVSRRIEGFAQTSNGRVLVRHGPANRPLFGDELLRVVTARSLERYERTPTPVGLEHIHRSALAELAEASGWESPSDPDRLQEVGLARVADSGLFLTVAGALHLLERPDEVIPKAYVEVMRYPSDDADYDRRLEIRGPLGKQIRGALDVVLDELGSEFVVVGAMRHEMPRLPTVVLREALANAVAHRSYEASGTAVRVEIRPSSVLVRSPGGLPEPVTVENMRSAAAARNPDTIRALRQLGLAEDSGRGVDVMQDTMLSELLQAPDFRDLGHAVEVALPLHSAVSPQERAWLRSIESAGEIRPADKVLLVHASRGEPLTNAKVRDLLGIDSVQARHALGRLRTIGALQQRGERGGTRYHLTEGFAPEGSRSAEQDDYLEGLLHLAATQPLTNARVRAYLGIDRTQAQRLLKALVRLGALRQEGERRGARYVLAQPPLPEFDGG